MTSRGMTSKPERYAFRVSHVVVVAVAVVVVVVVVAVVVDVVVVGDAD